MHLVAECLVATKGKVPKGRGSVSMVPCHRGPRRQGLEAVMDETSPYGDRALQISVRGADRLTLLSNPEVHPTIDGGLPTMAYTTSGWLNCTC